MRKKWAEGTVLYTRDGAEYKITDSNEAGGTAIIYYAEKAGSGIRAVLKEFYPEGWERRKGVPVERAYVDSPDEDQGLLSCYEKLAKQARREMTISQKIADETVHVWPVRGMLDVRSIREPDGTVWQAESTLPCCILEMDNLNHKDGLWLQDILREAGKKKSKETPLGNLRPNSKPVLAVPLLQVTLMLVWRLLILLAKIHEAGYLHGDINLGNVFLAMDDTGGNILNAMLIDFGSARALVNGETAPLGKEPVMATPGFAAPELAGSGEQRLTPKADVYAVGKLMHCLLDQNILEALRKGWYSDLEEELKAPTLNASGINDPQITPAVQKSLDQILSGAAEKKSEKRSSVQEMMEQVMQLYREIEPPAWQMSLGLLQLNGDEVLGRDEDIKKIEAKLWAEGKLVLHGFSGIGKTKLVTLLGHKWLKNYPCSQVYYAFYPGSMTGLAVDTLARNMSTVAFTEKKNGKDVPRPVAGIIDDMFRELNAHMHENDLLIIDNVDDDTKKFWNSVVHEETVQGQTDLFTRLCQLNCKVLFVTRLDVSDTKGIAPFKVDKLELEPLRAILRKYSEDAQKRSDVELDALVDLVERHTMTVDMMARTMKESRLTVPEIYDELSRDGGYDSDAFVEIDGQKDTDNLEDRIEGHLIRLFRLANFNEQEQNMLRYAQLIGENSGMYKTLFLSCCPHKTKGENTQNLQALNHLVRLGYIQQKKEEDAEKVVLNLHTLVRVVAKKVLPIEENQADTFLEGMPIPYRRYGVKISSYDRSSIAEAYTQARKIAEKETFLFGYWSSCASAWFFNMRNVDKENTALKIIEYLPEAVCVYVKLKNGQCTVPNNSNVQDKIHCLYWNIWNVLGYATPGMVRQKCGMSEVAKAYWTFCLDEPERKLTSSVLFQEYERCNDLREEIRQKLLEEFYPNDYWDYWPYTDIADKENQIRTGKELLEHFERKTPEDYEHYLRICKWLTESAKEIEYLNDPDGSKGDRTALFEQEEKRAAYEYLDFLRRQNPMDYDEIIQLCWDCIDRSRSFLADKEMEESYRRILLDMQRSYSDVLLEQQPSNVVAQVMCCDYIIRALPDKEEIVLQYLTRSRAVQLDFVVHPEKYLPVRSPLDELEIFNRVMERSADKALVKSLCYKILKVGHDHEKLILRKQPVEKTEETIKLSPDEKFDCCIILKKAAVRLGQEELARRYNEAALELRGFHANAQLLRLRQMKECREKGVPYVQNIEYRSSITDEADAILHDLQDGNMTEEKDQHYRQMIFEKAADDELWRKAYEKDLDQIVDAYEEAGDYRRQLKWLKQIILLQSAGLWSLGMLSNDDVLSGRTPDGKLTPIFYHGHYYMEPYYERAIRAAQKSYDDESLIELAEDLFYVLSQDNRARNQEGTFLEVSDLFRWLRACGLYAYCCCIQKKYTRAGNALLVAEKNLKNSIDNWNEKAAEEAEKAKEAEEFSEQWYMNNLQRYKMIAEELNKQREPMFRFFEERLVLLEKILPEHHPLLSMQRELMIWFCDDDKKAKKLERQNKKEKLFALFHNWDSWWEPDT